jgi:chromosomal replication initiation ATPase DnaA
MFPYQNWIWIGSDSFAKRIRKLVSPTSREPNVLRARNRPDLRIDDVFEAVCAEFRIPVLLLPQKSCRHPARSIAALLAREYSTATLQEIAKSLGLADRRSVPQVIRRAMGNSSDEIRYRLAAILSRLGVINDTNCGRREAADF